MPDFSGRDVIESLKQDELIESRNIVIFTASSDQDVLKKMRNSGIKEIFKKPFSIEDLIKLMEKYRPTTLNFILKFNYADKPESDEER